MSPKPTPKSNFAQASKNPAAWALVFIAGLVSAVVTTLVRSDGRTGDAKEQIAVWQRMYHEKDSTVTALTYQLLIKDAAKDAAHYLADSAARK